MLGCPSVKTELLFTNGEVKQSQILRHDSSAIIFSNRELALSRSTDIKELYFYFGNTLIFQITNPILNVGDEICTAHLTRYSDKHAVEFDSTLHDVRTNLSPFVIARNPLKYPKILA